MGNILRICNATITATLQDRQHMADSEIRSRDVHITDSTLAWIAGKPGITYGFSPIYGLLQRVSFEHGPVGLCNAQQWAEDCVFRDLAVAVLDGAGIDATLVRCRFEGNRRNWALTGSQFGIMAIDCDFGE